MITDGFYGKVQADERVNFFFRWVDLENQSCKLKDYLAYSLEKSIDYSGKSIKSAHGHLVNFGLENTHFDILKEHLIASFSESGVSRELLTKIQEIVEGARKLIFSKD